MDAPCDGLKSLPDSLFYILLKMFSVSDLFALDQCIECIRMRRTLCTFLENEVVVMPVSKDTDGTSLMILKWILTKKLNLRHFYDINFLKWFIYETISASTLQNSTLNTHDKDEMS